MPRREAQLYLRDILQACDDLCSHLHGVTEEQFLCNRLVRAAVEREFSIIGEAIVQVLKARPDLAGRISDAESISHFRNILVHAYDIVQPRRIYGTGIRSIPILRAEVALILSEPRP